MAGCINITGSCLEVIRSSAVLELLDIRLVRMHESPVLDPEPLISESIVIPILDSIMERRKLKLLHLPKMFRMNQSTEMEEFIDRYDDYLETFRYKCSKCELLCRSTGSESWMYHDIGEEYERVQNYTCSKCLVHFCFDTHCTDEDGDVFIEWCQRCEKHFCLECVPSDTCSRCGRCFCDKCDALEKVCDDGDCEGNMCRDCVLLEEEKRNDTIEEIASLFGHLKDIAVEESEEGKKFVESCNNIANDEDVEGSSLKEKLTTLIANHHNGRQH